MVASKYRYLVAAGAATAVVDKEEIDQTVDDDGDNDIDQDPLPDRAFTVTFGRFL
jgi:hypothetical protein